MDRERAGEPGGGALNGWSLVESSRLEFFVGVFS